MRRAMFDFYVNAVVFYLIAILTGVCAIATVVSHNIVRSATWLLFTLAGTSAIFFVLGADIVGAIQLLVYVGGTMVLVVFGVMLTAQGPFINMKTSGAEWAISIVAGILLFSVLCGGTYSYLNSASRGAGPATGALAIKYGPQNPSRQDPQSSHHAATIAQALVGAPYGPAYDQVSMKKDQQKGEQPVEYAPVGTHYLLPFEIVSVHLLVVLIAAAYLARAKRAVGKGLATSTGDQV